MNEEELQNRLMNLPSHNKDESFNNRMSEFIIYHDIMKQLIDEKIVKYDLEKHEIIFINDKANEYIENQNKQLQQENTQLKEQRSKAIDHLNSKQIRFINEKDYILTDDDLDEIMQIFKINKED